MAETQNEKLTPEDIEKNWKKFLSVLEKLGDRSAPALELANTLDERLALAPASGRIDYHNCFPGGLVDHSLRVLNVAAKLCKAFEWNVPKDSLIITCLFHDLGKLGDLTHDYYVQQDSSWHREKLGELYKRNEAIMYMTVPDRGLWLLQHFGLKLSQEETLAIKLHDGQYAEENKQYKMREPLLADIVHMADYIATKQEKSLSQSDASS